MRLPGSERHPPGPHIARARKPPSLDATATMHVKKRPDENRTYTRPDPGA